MALDPRPIIARFYWQARRLSRVLWVRVALYTALAFLAALSAELFDGYIPDGPKDRFTQATTLPILTVLANGMLAVVTFSLGVMVSSHRTLADQSTPRIHRLLAEDSETQTVLATFLGAFVFALTSLILFRAGYYSDSAAVIVFGATVFVVAAIVLSLVRWIGQLSRIGSLAYALDQAEAAAEQALTRARDVPQLGGVAWSGDGPPDGPHVDIPAPASGYVAHIDIEELQSLAKDRDARIYVRHLPGARVLRGQPVGWITGDQGDDAPSRCFVVSENRTIQDDPNYALAILREAASKALSPGINDQGTAVEVIARLERLLWNWSHPEGEHPTPEPAFDRVYLPPLDTDALIIQAFRAIVRDGAGNAEVLLTMISVLCRLRACTTLHPEAAIDEVLRDIWDHAQQGLTTEREITRIRAALADAGLDV